MSFKKISLTKKLQEQKKKKEVSFQENGESEDEDEPEQQFSDEEGIEDWLEENPKGTSEDPLYDDKLDDEDEKWVNEKLSKYLGGFSSDAILNCPCCFTLLTMHCQKHSTFFNQFRAMFVQNCKVLDKEIRYKKESPSKKHKSNSNEQKKKPATENYKPYQYIDNILVEDEYLFDEEIYKLVNCKMCDTEVAVLDADEMFHFFNVIPSEV